VTTPTRTGEPTVTAGGSTGVGRTRSEPIQGIGGGVYTGVSGDLLGKLTGEQRDAYAALNNLFASYGLGSLAGKIFDYIQKGYSADTISILLQDTPEYKQRFAGNEARRQKGLPVLSPAEYLSTESSYRQLMRQAGLPAGFYDQPSDFSDFIGKDVSPTELKSRVDLASQATALASPEYKRALQQMYGLDEGHITAYFLDADRALPTIQKQAAAAAIGAEALKRGLQVSGKAEDYALAGVSSQQAAQAYGTIAQQLPEYAQFAHSFGENVNQQTFEEALFTGGQEAGKLERLASWNRARAEGAAGAAATGLARTSQGRV
jgi:hypothetical protein